LTNRGFVELHNPTGFFIIAFGFVLVTLAVIAGGLVFRVLAREDAEKRKAAREKLEEERES
jgi:hypothetical protein